MEKELEKQIKNLDWSSDDDYLKVLEKALEDYHKMVNDGTLIPRGNRVAEIIVNRDNRI